MPDKSCRGTLRYACVHGSIARTAQTPTGRCVNVMGRGSVAAAAKENFSRGNDTAPPSAGPGGRPGPRILGKILPRIPRSHEGSAAGSRRIVSIVLRDSVRGSFFRGARLPVMSGAIILMPAGHYVNIREGDVYSATRPVVPRTTRIKS